MRGFHRLALVLALFLSAPALRAQEGDPEKARAADILIEKAKKLIDAGDYLAALEPLGDASPLNPTEGLADYLAAHCQFQLYAVTADRGRLLGARESIEESLKRDPRPGDAWFLGGLILARLEAYGDAVSYFENALERGTRAMDCRINLAQCLHFWGVQLADDPEADPAMVTRIVMGATDRLAALKDDFRIGEDVRAHLDRLWRNALVNLGALYQRTGHLEEAEAVLRRLTRLEPNNYLYRYNLGLFLGSADRPDEALAQYEKALELRPDPDWIAPYPMMGWILSVKGENERAEKLFSEYIERFPYSWEAWYRLGGHQARRGRFEDAVKSFQRCVELDPRTLVAMEEMAAALSKAGREADAAKWTALFKSLEKIYRVK